MILKWNQKTFDLLEAVPKANFAAKFFYRIAEIFRKVKF